MKHQIVLCAAVGALALGGCMSQQTMRSWDGERLCNWVQVQGDSALEMAQQRGLIRQANVADVRARTVAIGFNRCEVLAARGMPTNSYRSADGFTAWHYSNGYGSLTSFYFRNGVVVDWSKSN